MKPALVFFGRFDQHGPGAVAEQNASRPVRVVDDARHGVGADHQHLAVRAAGYQIGCRRQPVNEARAGSDQIEAPGVLGAQLVLHQAGGRGEQHVGRDRTDDDGVQFGGRDAALGQRVLRRFARHVGGRHVRIGDVPLADPGTLQDPLVGGIDHLFQVLVRQDAGRRVTAEGRNFRFGQCVSHDGLWLLRSGAAAQPCFLFQTPAGGAKKPVC